jgi:hypothetical protein
VKKSSTPLLFEHGERPGPVGKLAGDGDLGGRGTVLAGVETLPALVQSAVALVAADPGPRGGEFPPIPHGLARHPVRRGRPRRRAGVRWILIPEGKPVGGSVTHLRYRVSSPDAGRCQGADVDPGKSGGWLDYVTCWRR